MYKLGFCIHGPNWCARRAALLGVLQRVLTRAVQPLPAPEAAWPGADAGASAHDGHATGPTRQRGAHARLGALVMHACGRIPYHAVMLTARSAQTLSHHPTRANRVQRSPA